MTLLRGIEVRNDAIAEIGVQGARVACKAGAHSDVGVFNVYYKSSCKRHYRDAKPAFSYVAETEGIHVFQGGAQRMDFTA